MLELIHAEMAKFTDEQKENTKASGKVVELLEKILSEIEQTNHKVEK